METDRQKEMKFLLGHRFWMHFPIGVLGALLACAGLFYPKVMLTGFFLSGSMMFGFYVYEVMNDWRKKDWSYKDIIGAVVGFGFTGSILLGLWIWTVM